MKIISKYKDYYDYLQGVYGVDEKLILDRRKGYHKPIGYAKEVLFICGKVIEFYVRDNKVYIGRDEISSIASDPLKKRWLSLKDKEMKTLFINDSNNFYSWSRIVYTELSEDKYNIYPGARRFYKECPIFLYNHFADCYDCEFPKLEVLKIPSVLSAHDIWNMLSQWLGERVTEKEPIVPVGDDKVRILSAGFDLKTSFRH